MASLNFVINVGRMVALLCLIFQANKPNTIQQAHYGLSLIGLFVSQVEKRSDGKE